MKLLIKTRSGLFLVGSLILFLILQLALMMMLLFEWNNDDDIMANPNKEQYGWPVMIQTQPRMWPRVVLLLGNVSCCSHQTISSTTAMDFNGHKMREPDDPRTRPTCSLMGEWQASHHPVCNHIHEMDLGHFGGDDDDDENVRLVNNGAFRDVWMVRQEHAYPSRVALKTLRYVNKRVFDRRNFDRHRRDAVAFDELSASPYVVHMHAHCANSAVFDFCDSGMDLYNLFDAATGGDDDVPSKMQLLKVAQSVAQSVADAHHFDHDNRPTIAHTDIKPDQWIYMKDGGYLLNDFNRARFLAWDHNASEVCPFRVDKNGGIWRSPEEYRYEGQTEKGDVWSLGNVLYFLLTQGSLPHEDMLMRYEDENFAEHHVIEHVKQGGRPLVKNETILHSTHPFDVALLRALDMCFVLDPKKRATSRQVADFLMQSSA